MIHQLIFAAPRPGLSPAMFQDYWIHVHAQDFASKIPQIKKYKVSRIFTEGEDLAFHGMAEIWLENEAEQLESLQSSEFINGARADEPKWAAFWASLCLDTTTQPIIEAPAQYTHKRVILMKRKGGIPLSVFRKYALDTLGNAAQAVGDVQGACLCIANDGLYALGEARFDGAFQLWFSNRSAGENAKATDAYKRLLAEIHEACDCVLDFMCEETTII